MPFIKSDIIDGNGARLTTKGWEFDRIFVVSELTAPGYAMLVEAVDFTGVQFGDPHPEIPLAKAFEFLPASIPNSGNSVRITIPYREFSQDYRVELGSRVLTTETANSFDNPNDPNSPSNAMVLQYAYPADYKANASKANTLADEQGIRVSVQDYYPTIVITRTEFTTISADTLSGHPVGITLTGEILTDRGLNYNGYTNLAGWNIRPSDPEHVWRCEITSSSAEDGLAYRVRYAFSYDPNQWRFNATYIDPITGQSVPDPGDVFAPFSVAPVIGVSEFDFDQYLAQDFTLLELY